MIFDNRVVKWSISDVLAGPSIILSWFGSSKPLLNPLLFSPT